MVKEGYKETEIGVIPEDWEVILFGNCFKILPNNTLSRSELNDDIGTVKNIHYGDILIRFNNILNCSNEKISYIANVPKNVNPMLLKDGDIVIADTAEDETVGKTIEISYTNNQQIVSGLHTIPCRKVSPELFANGWLGYYMNHSMYHDQLLPFITGTKVSAISKSAIVNTFILIPSYIEQQHIAEALSDMDNLISSLEKLIEKKKAIKQACLQKMFPKPGETVPEMRLPGFTEPWEQRKLSEITSYSNGKGHEKSQSEEGNYELINLNSISIDGGLKSSGKFIEDGTETLLKNDLVMVLSDVGHGDLLGRVAIIPDNNRFVLNQRMALLRITDNTNPYFLFSIINKNQSYFKKEGAGSSQLNISKASVENFVINYPEIEEQKRIADYFRSLDDLITLHQRKLEKCKKIKQGMMEQLLTGKIRLTANEARSDKEGI